MAPVPRPAAVQDGAPEADVVLVTVTYNSAAIVERFLRALPDALDGIGSAQVVVVDNDSADGTVERVVELAPWAVAVKAGANLGYGAGLNLGIGHVRARRGVLVLNPDAVLEPGAVRRLLDAVEADHAVGIAVPRIVDATGKLKFSLRREPTILRAIGEALLGGHRAARFPLLGDMIRDPSYYVDGATADWATGAAMFLSRRVLDAVGPWSEEFFLYSEETDYALRARDAGYRIGYVWDAVAAHPGGAMSKSPWLWSLVAVNRTKLYRKRHGAVRSAVYWGVVVFNEGVRALLGRPTHRAAVKALLCGKVGSRLS
ncbi:glycosyltransferase family 2 protein [Jiangella rhizosphaerae]|uniref:Glycosyltransferase family 2 protein n=1 Tax=Jiangella rhizosphaerae TaxID=2293569 RepID=A0A418KRP1_9ACTN|nr:glycosyltransferase family 2 protein [Jiangella rhizosphaerae]RIQ25258.1 glycosyltransferase family 2 protein [Jiangella rhizosphaerae]